MGLESGTFVDDLVVTNPPGSDSKSQGDDHLRLIKNVLRNTFKRASKSFSLPGVVSKNANYAVLATDENMTIECDTSGGAFTLTLPATAGISAGWTLYVFKKTTDANPVFIQPAAGTINSFAKIRRAIDFQLTRVLWSGSVWVATRPHGLQIGTSMPFHGGGLPNGYVWADGGAINSTNYPELAIYLGSNVPDLRGRGPFGKDDMGGSAANRITAGGSGISGNSLGATGGEQAHTLTTAELASHNHGVTDPGHNHTHTDPGHTHGSPSLNDPGHNHGVTDPGHSHGVSGGTQGGTTSGSVQGGASSAPVTNSAISINSNTTGVTVNSGGTNITLGANTGSNTTGVTNNSNTTGISVNSNGSGSAHNNMPPALICNYIVLAE